MRISILDQSPVSTGMSPAQALQNTIALARLGDRLGYARYWIAEHHAMSALASPAPEILLARIGGETERIRIGSGAVLLPHYAPLKVAEQFQMLHALYPDRIDLGIGRAPGGTALEATALRRNREAVVRDDFPQQLLELLAFLRHEFPADHPFGRIHLAPAMPGGPDVWLLGSSLWSASAAAQIGLPYAFAHFITPEPTGDALHRYRAMFDATVHAPAPRTMVALGVICAETQAEAERLFLSPRLLTRRIRAGIIEPVPSPEDAALELKGEPEPTGWGQGRWPRYAVGTPDRVRAQLEAMAAELGIDEFMAVTITHDHAARMRSYELLADAFALGKASAAARSELVPA